ncbi:MAG: Ig-like domain-containing protein [Candidatus Komeilibacteria bacterium]
MLFLKRKYFIKMRTVLVLAMLFVTVLFLFPSGVLASTDFGLADANPGLGDTDLKQIIVNIIQIALGFIGLIAVIFILYAGFVWMTAGGAADKVDKAKKILIRAAIGLVIVLSSYAIATFIFNAIGWSTGIDMDGTSRDRSYYYSGGLAGGVIQSHYPARGATGIPRNVSIVVTFKESMDADSIISGGQLTDNITIVDQFGDEVAVASAETVDNYSFLINPTEPDYLGTDADNITYVVSLGSGILKSNGDPAFGNLGSYEWQFTTSTDLDVSPPRIVSVLPGDASTNPRNAVVQINFNEAINPLSVAGDTADGFDNIIASNTDGTVVINGKYTIANEYKTVEFLTDDLCGTNSCGGDVYCLPGAEELAFNVKASTLEAIIFDGAVDMVGNSLDGNADGQAEGPGVDDYEWSFNTTNNVDLSPPSVVSVTPGVSSNSVSTRANVKVSFDKLMMLSSLNADSLMIDQGVNYWISSTNKENHTESYIKHDEFGEYVTYNPLVTNECRDLYQNCFNPTSGPGDFRIGGDDTDNTWAAGSKLGDINDTQVPGQLRLNFKGADTPYLWVARSNLDQVVRVSTADGSITGPYIVGDNPSRTSVDSYGRVWVANRNSNDITVILTDAEGNELLNETFSTSPANGPRGVAVDINNDVWVAGGCYVVKLSGQTNTLGDRLTYLNKQGGCRAYGAVIDRDGRLWIPDRNTGRGSVIDTETATVIATPMIGRVGQLYGITADPDGNIWEANSWGASTVSKVDGSDYSYVEYSTGGGAPRGVAVDKNGNIWVTNWSLNKVAHLRPDGTLIDLYPTGSGPLGVSADADGYVWVVNYSGGGPAPRNYTNCSGGTTTKYDMEDGTPIGTYCVGGNPYTYSDMTGFGYQSVVKGLVSGEWTSSAIDLEGLSSVGGLFIHGDIPVGASVKMQARGAGSQAGLAETTWQDVASDGTVSITNVSWLQIKLELQSVRINVTPSINYISINKISLE